MAKLKVNIQKIIIIGLFIFIFFGSFVLAQEIQKVEQKEILSTKDNEFITQNDLIQFQRESIWQLATINLGYLGICIAIILLLGGIFYLFNLKPLEEKVNKTKEDLKNEIAKSINAQEEKIEILKNQTKQEITFVKQRSLEDIKYLQNNIKEESKKLNENIKSELNIELGKAKQQIQKLELEINNKLTTLTNEYRTLEVLMDWNQHYVWEIRGVHINALTSLMGCLELTIEYNWTYWFDLILDEINKELSEMIKSRYLPPEKENYLKLVRLLGKIEGFEKEKEEILNKAKKIFGYS